MPAASSRAVRVHDEPAFVLHHYDWSESSLILEVFSRNHGRLALVAKGVKRPTSQFRPVLLPLQPLRLGWSGDAEIKTLKSAQWQGGHVMPTGDALLSGYYLNELLLKLLARDDPHPALFQHYLQAVGALSDTSLRQASVLRAFELLLLREMGLLPSLDLEGASLSRIDPVRRYALTPDAGLREVWHEEAMGTQGQSWLNLQHALDAFAGLPELANHCADADTTLRQQLRGLLHYHCGVQAFQTRQLMVEAQRLAPIRLLQE